MKRTRSGKRTKAQHYVPRLHLRQFLGQSPMNMVWVYSKARGTALPSRVEETGQQTNYYSVRDDNGDYHDAIDNMFDDIETKAAAPYRALLAGQIPHDQARADFAVFVATCFTRSPALIRAYAEGTARAMHLELRLNAKTREGFDRLTDAMESETGKVIADRERAYKFINDPSRYSIGISEKRGLAAIGIADDIAPILYDRPWTLVESLGAHFITSDNPVYRWVPPETRHPFYGDGGFKNARAEITFPLSPTLLLLIGGNGKMEARVSVDSATVWQMNEMRATAAEDLIFADRKDEHVRKLARRYRDNQPRLQIGHELAEGVDVKITR